MTEALDQLLPPGGALRGRLFSRLLEAANDEGILEKGTLVGYWRVGEMLGRGGSSAVYLADRADGQFAQRVALKVVRPNQELTEHFRRERQILAELRHPAIAQLIDGGQTASGRLWFAMEPVFGERMKTPAGSFTTPELRSGSVTVGMPWASVVVCTNPLELWLKLMS